MNNYRAYLLDKQSHKSVLAITFKSEGYLTALDDARQLCANNHENLYVGQVVKV